MKARVGAVFAKGWRFIAEGNNRYMPYPPKGFPKEARSIHAEQDCAAELAGITPRWLRSGTLYVYREASYGEALAKPCSMCMKIIKAVGIRRVVFSTGHGPALLRL